jgi:hypothetical protein
MNENAMWVRPHCDRDRDCACGAAKRVPVHFVSLSVWPSPKVSETTLWLPKEAVVVVTPWSLDGVFDEAATRNRIRDNAVINE